MFWQFHIPAALFRSVFVKGHANGKSSLDCAAYDFHVGDTFYDTPQARTEGVAWRDSEVQRAIQVVGVPTPTKGNESAVVYIEDHQVYCGRVVATTRKTITTEELTAILLGRRA